MENDQIFKGTEPWSYFLKRYWRAKRIVPLIGSIDSKLIEQTSATLLELETEDIAPITLYIHTNGGNSGFYLENIINALHSPVDGLVIGRASSMGGIILQMCRKRMMLPQSTLYAHYPTVTHEICGRFDTINEEDIRFMHQEYLESHQKQVLLYSKRTGKTTEEIEKFFRLGELFNRDITAAQAKEFGLIDVIVTDFKFYSKDFKGRKSVQ